MAVVVVVVGQCDVAVIGDAVRWYDAVFAVITAPTEDPRLRCRWPALRMWTHRIGGSAATCRLDCLAPLLCVSNLWHPVPDRRRLRRRRRALA